MTWFWGYEQRCVHFFTHHQLQGLTKDNFRWFIAHPGLKLGFWVQSRNTWAAYVGAGMCVLCVCLVSRLAGTVYCCHVRKEPSCGYIKILLIWHCNFLSSWLEVEWLGWCEWIRVHVCVCGGGFFKGSLYSQRVKGSYLPNSVVDWTFWNRETISCRILHRTLKSSLIPIFEQ